MCCCRISRNTGATPWRSAASARSRPSTYPPNAPLTARPDFRGQNGYAATSVTELSAQVLDHWGASLAILNCLYGVQLVYNEDMARAFHRALNDWVKRNGSTAIRGCAPRS